eukprot:7186547-Prymnesium_polylepis.1
MPSKTYKEPRVCDCGYTTNFSSAWFVHKKICKLVVTSEKEVIATLREQLAAKDQQLAAKDQQRTVKSSS